MDINRKSFVINHHLLRTVTRELPGTLKERYHGATGCIITTERVTMVLEVDRSQE